jgi:hypothetical protein
MKSQNDEIEGEGRPKKVKGLVLVLGGLEKWIIYDS